MKNWQDRLKIFNQTSEEKMFVSPFQPVEKIKKFGPSLSMVMPQDHKKAPSLKDAVLKSGLRDGMTISFHHHFRSGDAILNQVLDQLSEMGFKDLTVAASSLTSIHEPLIEHIHNGVIKKIETSGLRGKLAEEISKGIMDEPVIFRSHGGRARAIEVGETHIDVAFLGVPSCDCYGNANGFSGSAICGSLGYAKVDAEFAEHVVLITDKMVDYPNMPASISQNRVDSIVVFDNIGDSEKIASGETRFTKNPKELQIARFAADVIENTPYFKEGFSFQTGSGGSALAVTRFLKERMLKHKIKASFALGGITKPIVELHEEGLINTLFDVQSFDLIAANSLRKNPNHIEIDASLYANIHSKGCVANRLNYVVLSALEIDKSFNVNVLTGSNGVIMGASGGHCDTAACADVTIIVAPLFRGRIPTVVEEVQTVITPGESVDVLVTERGVAINPRRKDLMELLSKTELPIVEIEELVSKASQIIGSPKAIEYTDQIVGLVEYRDGCVIDVVKAVKE